MASPDGRLPDDELLAAIAAAYSILQRRAPSAAAPLSRWRLAARLGPIDAAEAKIIARIPSLWRAAGRVR